jgi:hypothetical protein
MNNITANLFDCKHCEGTGTCRNGKDGCSCAVCIKRNELPKNEYFGLACGSCGGIGKAEPTTERMNKRIAPALAITLVVSLLVMISFSSIMQNKYFSELLAFSSAIIGSLVGFYFSHQNKN